MGVQLVGAKQQIVLLTTTMLQIIEKTKNTKENQQTKFKLAPYL